MILETDRLKIRNLNLADKNLLFEIYSDKEAMQFRGSKPFATLEKVDEMLVKTLQKFEAKKNLDMLLTIKKITNLLAHFY
jgi:ribosomal-protein-alanine N-acetyltransferase